MFEPVNDVERLLIAAAGDIGARPAFVAAALAGDLYLSPVQEQPPGAGIGPIAMAIRPDGRGGAALFTAPIRVREALGSEARVLARNGREALEWVRRGGAHINPTLDYSVVWTPADVEEILTGARPMAIPHDTKILPLNRGDIPVALTSALAGALERLTGVSEAWLALGERGTKTPGWLLGVDHFGPWDEVDAAVRKAVAGLDLEGRLFAAMPLGDDPLSRALRGGIPIVAPKAR